MNEQREEVRSSQQTSWRGRDDRQTERVNLRRRNMVININISVGSPLSKSSRPVSSLRNEQQISTTTLQDFGYIDLNMRLPQRSAELSTNGIIINPRQSKSPTFVDRPKHVSIQEDTESSSKRNSRRPPSTVEINYPSHGSSIKSDELKRTPTNYSVVMSTKEAPSTDRQQLKFRHQENQLPEDVSPTATRRIVRVNDDEKITTDTRPSYSQNRYESLRTTTSGTSSRTKPEENTYSTISEYSSYRGDRPRSNLNDADY